MNLIEKAYKNPAISFLAIFFMGVVAVHQFYDITGKEVVTKGSFITLVNIEDKYVHKNKVELIVDEHKNKVELIVDEHKNKVELIVDENKVCKSNFIKSESHSQILRKNLDVCKQVSKKHLDNLNSITDNALNNTDEFINRFDSFALPVLKARINNILSRSSSPSLSKKHNLHMLRDPICHKVSPDIAQKTLPNHIYINQEVALYHIESMHALTSFYSGAMNYPKLPVDFRLLSRERSLSNLIALKNKYLFDLTKHAKTLRDDWTLPKLARPFIYYSHRISNTKEFKSKLEYIQKTYLTRDITVADFYNAGFPRNQNPCIADSGIEEGYYKFWFRRFNDGTYEQVKMIAEYLSLLD